MNLHKQERKILVSHMEPLNVKLADRYYASIFRLLGVKFELLGSFQDRGDARL